MPPTVKRQEIRCSSASRRGVLRNVMRSNLFFCINKEYFILECLKSCFAAITYQIKHYFDFSNCKFTHSFLISAIWRGSPCRRSSDDANTDWVHCQSPRCRVKCRGSRNERPIVWSTILALSDKWLSLDIRPMDEQIIIAQMSFINLGTSTHLVSDKCWCHVTCPKDECFSNFTATSVSGRLCCLRSRANVGATLGVRPRPWQQMLTLWRCRPTSHC